MLVFLNNKLFELDLPLKNNKRWKDKSCLNVFFICSFINLNFSLKLRCCWFMKLYADKFIKHMIEKTETVRKIKQVTYFGGNEQ